MQLSIIIVNYNIRHFLEQCLHSVKAAIDNLEAEVIVVDNNSSDQSVAYLTPRFPWVNFIDNKINLGFAKANNQALQHATGKYILFLNPDTLIPTDCLEKCIHFLEEKQDVGALGIRMLDGSGNFLPESKRAFPAPFTSMFKLLGFARLFPKSSLFARYYLGHLEEKTNHEVDVLAGAFMMVRKKVLDEVGCFDENFFMYGEDIDLSYRIQQAGWQNYYFAESAIIHFKGESTKKGSLNYVRMFYQAMNLFVQKHYSSGKAGFFKVFIQLAIWLRAVVSAAGRLIKKLGLPVIDILITLGSLWLVAWFWGKFVKPELLYPKAVLFLTIPIFTLIFIAAGAIAGLYDKWYRPARAWLAMMVALIINLAVYSLLEVEMRFFRGVMLFGGLLASLIILFFRTVLVRNQLISAEDERFEKQQTLIVGSEAQYQSVLRLMQLANRNERVLGRVSIKEGETNTTGSFAELDKLLRKYPAREIIFCIGDELTLGSVLDFLQRQQLRIRYKFHYAGSDSIVGSDNKETSGESLTGNETFGITQPEQRRMKRISDIAWGIFLLITWPLQWLLVKKPLGLLANIFSVITGKKTWVGYCTANTALPYLRPAIIGCNSRPRKEEIIKDINLSTVDYWYAKDFDWLNDSRIILDAYRHLGC